MKWKEIKISGNPKENETVWACNANTGFVKLACWVWAGEGWLWAESNGIVYSENGIIVSECECDDDYDFTHWMPLPKLPNPTNLKTLKP